MAIDSSKEKIEYTIREIKESDSISTLRLVMDMADESDNFPFTSEDYGMSPENQKAFINYMHQMENCIYYGAFIDQEPIGVIYLEGGRRKKTFHVCNLGMGIRKDYWGRGIGKKLMSRALNYAKNSDCIAKVDLQVRTDNTFAIKLYRSFGFEIEGKSRRALFIDNAFYDYLNMGKIID